MAGEVTHLMAGRDNGDGTVTVTSIISLCCRMAFPKGLGTLDPAAVTCPGGGHEIQTSTTTTQG